MDVRKIDVRLPFLLLAFTACASSPAAPALAAVRFGITAGAQWTRFAQSFEPDSALGTAAGQLWSGTGFAGVTLQRPAGVAVVLATGMEFGVVSDRVRFSAGPFAGTRLVRLHMLSVPLCAEWHHGPWFIGAGPEVRVLLDAHREFEALAGDSLGSTDTILVGKSVPLGRRQAGPLAQIIEQVGTFDASGDVTELYERVGLAARVAAGREFRLGPRVLRAELRWTEGLTHVGKSPLPAARMRAAQLGLGFTW